MKIILAMFAFLPALALANTPEEYPDITVQCNTVMNQYKADSAMFPLIGDTNQNFEFVMSANEDGEYTGESQVRYMNDQSEDNTNSLHGARAYVTYSEGNGFNMLVNILKFADHTDGSASQVVGVIAAEPEGDLGNDVLRVNASFFNLLVASPADIENEMKGTGKLKDYDLFSISVSVCYQTN